MRDHPGTRAEQIIARLDGIADELNAGPRLKQHIVTALGEFLDDFENSTEASEWKAHRAQLAKERRRLIAEWESLTEADENRP